MSDRVEAVARANPTLLEIFKEKLDALDDGQELSETCHLHVAMSLGQLGSLVAILEDRKAGRLASLPVEGEGASWLPIESAPKDVPILLFFECRDVQDDALVDICYWDDDFCDEGAWVLSCECASTHARAPGRYTHWMPLPKPPTVNPTPNPTQTEGELVKRLRDDGERVELDAGVDPAEVILVCQNAVKLAYATKTRVSLAPEFAHYLIQANDDAILEIERLRKALEPFAKAANNWDDENEDADDGLEWPDKTPIVFQRGDQGLENDCIVGDLRLARRLLPQGEG